MNNKGKQIKEMAKVMCIFSSGCEKCEKYGECDLIAHAMLLYEQGYRKVDDIVEKVTVERPSMSDLLNEEMQSLMCDGKVCFTADEMVEQANELIKLAEENEALKKQKASNLVVEFVLSGEELEKITNECLENVEYNIQEIRKETAREILQEISEIHTENIGYTDWLDDTYFGDEFDKIAKRYGLKTKQTKEGVEVE